MAHGLLGIFSFSGKEMAFEMFENVISFFSNLMIFLKQFR